MVVSEDGKYFACSDSNNCISLFKKDHLAGDEKQPIEWQYTGKIMSHEVGIASICFG